MRRILRCIFGFTGLAPALAALWLLGGRAVALLAYSDDEPIRYSQTAAHDAVSRLQERLDSGEAKLEFDGEHGYLSSILKYLDVPASSQSLVFSKTSLQREYITPRKPRALYFNDSTYIGFVRGAPLLEFATIDPKLGTIFYTLNQEKTDRPHIIRSNYECLQCHESIATESVPGLLMRSVYPDIGGSPIQTGGVFVTSDQSPLHERFGGWYVTGSTGNQRHMGNITFDDEDHPAADVAEVNANITDLSRMLKTAAYLRDTSDAVALMVLAHQQHLHNVMTSTSYYVRTCEHLSRAQTRPAAEEARHAQQMSARTDTACEILVKAMLFCGEAQLTDAIKGTSGFAKEFSARGPVDSRGRSLRDFDLTHRLFKYPCSYLIYSEQFADLPDTVRRRVYRRLWEVLSGKDQSPAFGHLSADDRTAIREILGQTKKDLPAYWSPR